MASVVFLRAINVGGNLCKPAALAKRFAKFEMVNIGAVGTFVVRKDVDHSFLRKKLATQLAKDFGIKCEIMICPAKALLGVARKDPFAREPCGPEFTRFMSVLHESPRKRPRLPLILPEPKNIATGKPESSVTRSNRTSNHWLLKIIAIPGQFVIGIYRREMKAISYLGKIERILDMPATTRSWNTIEKVVKILDEN